MERFPLPYVLTNAITHSAPSAAPLTVMTMFLVIGSAALWRYFCASAYCGHPQYMREMMAGGGKMILGSDSQPVTVH